MKKVTTINMVLVCFLFACNDKKETLVGAWKAIADQQVNSMGNVVAQDANVSGILIYTADGNMSAQLLWHQRREALLSDSIMRNDGNANGVGLGNNSWTPEQNSTWIDTYDSYFGEYDVDWDKHIVTHSIDGNLRPEPRGKEYKRKFILTGDTLRLRSTDTTATWQVLWVRKGS